VAAAVGALVATGLAHVLIITTPRPLTLWVPETRLGPLTCCIDAGSSPA
jgi:hypothetical protein